jgi:hypothetical protein
MRIALYCFILKDPSEGAIMGSIEELRRERRKKAIEELRCNKVGILIQIVDRLEVMDLSVAEIDAIIGQCGLDEDCAVMSGMSVEREKGSSASDNLIYP